MTGDDMADSLFCVAETASGKIQGLINAGIRTFKGVPYGAPRRDRDRFMPPRKPIPWTGVRECFGYGPVSPQVPTEITHTYGQMIHLDLVSSQGGVGEDCLNLNIWTPALRDSGKRPVMFCIHGGGYHIISGNASLYDGAQLAQLGNVVVVSVTHRLASFGYINLVDVGAPKDFAFAGAAGIMDLVLALEWVRDNIEIFGGDPNRVMIFGQSGGGWKTSTLLAAPAAKGLFHRAAVQSGSQLRLQTREEAAQTASAFIMELGLTKDTITKIQTLPWQTLLAAQTKVGALRFSPVLDGDYLPAHPFDPAAPVMSADVPLIVSTTLDDAGLFFQNFDLDENGLMGIVTERYGDVAGELLKLYRKKWPKKSQFLLQAQIVTDAGFRRFAHVQAERKAAQKCAPVYLYRWDWASPAFDGLFGAAHATDVAASMGNAREAIMGSGIRSGRMLCNALAYTWSAFAATGNPNNSRIPFWPAFAATERATMIFDDPIRMENDPDRDLRLLWEAIPLVTSVFG